MVGKVASIAREPQARAAHLSSPSLMADFALYFERASFGVLRVMLGAKAPGDIWLLLCIPRGIQYFPHGL